MTKTTTGKRSYLSGQAAEIRVAQHYERDGWRVLEHRFKSAAGETDLVLRRQNKVLFVEVKRARTHDIAASRRISKFLPDKCSETKISAD